MIDSYRSLVWSVLVTTLLGMISINGLYLAVLRHEALQGNWLEEPMAKSYLLDRAQPFDHVFIGSSRTQNHINTALLDELGVHALNLGMAGRQWQYYPYVIDRTGGRRRLTLVISLPANALFRAVSCPDSLYYRWKMDRVEGIDSGCFRLHDLSWEGVLQELPMNRFLTALDELSSRRSTALEMARLTRLYGFHRDPDGRRVHYLRGDADRFVLLFTNGDGQVFSDRMARSRIGHRVVDRSQKAFHPEAMAFLRSLAAMATAAGHRVVYIIEPATIGKVDRIDMDTLRAALPSEVRVIDNASRRFPLERWADDAHFDLEGARQYTRLVATELSASSASDDLEPSS